MVHKEKKLRRICKPHSKMSAETEDNTVTTQPEGLGIISLAVLSLSTQVVHTRVPLITSNLILKTCP